MMRKLDEFLYVSRELVKADAQILECLEELRAALRLTFKDPHDKKAKLESDHRLTTFSLSLGVRDAVAEVLDQITEDAKSVALDTD